MRRDAPVRTFTIILSITSASSARPDSEKLSPRLAILLATPSRFLSIRSPACSTFVLAILAIERMLQADQHALQDVGHSQRLADGTAQCQHRRF